MKTFLHLGGHIILDFRNTWIQHGDTIEDRIESAKDLEKFVKQFFKQSHSLPPKKTHFSPKQYQFLMNFRKLLREVLDPISTGASPETQLKVLYNFFKEVELEPFWKKTGNKLDLHWAVKSDYQFALPFISETAKFLTTLDFRRLKKCKNHRCSHLFLDNSKNSSRNWCSMKSCGNIMKARAFKTRSPKK